MADVKEQVKKDYLSGIMPKELAERYDTSLNTIKSWIKRYGWSKLKDSQGAPSDGEGAPSDVRGAPPRKKRGGQPHNRNAVGHGAPKGNKNAEKYGFFSKYLPEETVSIIQEMPTDPLDVLWDQIQIAYAAIIRAQQIMFVRDRDDYTERTVMSGCSDTGSNEATSYQEAWDKQANFLSAQARAMSDLRGSIKQYDEMLHKRWDLATEEQKARIEVMKAKTQSDDFGEYTDDGFLEALNATAKEDWSDEEKI